MTRETPITSILLATLGGSAPPVITAIREGHPDHVCLICTPRTQATGRPGSEVEVAGIVKECSLTPDQYSTLTVPADDLDGAFAAIRARLATLQLDHPHAEFTADYTGGTKTMVGALILAALDAGNVALQVVTGSRADLVRVRDGTQSISPANDEALRLEWGMRPYLDAWRRYAYDEAAAGLAALPRPRNPLLRDRLNRARDLSRAFAAWDRFDHAEALRLLDIYAPVVSEQLGQHIGALKALTSQNRDKQAAFQIMDLWRNAERRAAQGHYDDAVARLYRLTESAAQWLLRVRADVETGNIDSAKLPEGVELTRNRRGQLQAGLYAAWQLLAALTDGPLARMFREQGGVLLDHLKARNESILAHGFAPLDEPRWQAFAGWISSEVLPAFVEEAGPRLVRSLPPQLPDHYPFSE